MSKITRALLFCFTCLITSCAVKTQVTNQYKLDAFSSKSLRERGTATLLVSQPEAVGGYQTEQMLYVKKPYEINAFVHNAWVSSPANMLFPLIMQSLQDRGYFYAVASTPYADKADYRLDTQLIELQQNFLTQPSVVELVVKVVLTHIADNRVIASQIISQRVACPQDTPYGGVIAANRATQQFTAILSDFVVTHIKHDNQYVMLSSTIAEKSKQLYNEPPLKHSKQTHPNHNKK